MLTIFTTCKPFVGLTDIHQTNAIQSWVHIPGVEVLILESKEPTLGVRHFMGVDCHESGLPYVNSLFKWAEILADNDLLVYANADLILLPDLVDAVRCASKRFDRFLMVGQRIDTCKNSIIDFEYGHQQKWLKGWARTGQLHSVSGKDWFAFRRPLGLEIPPFIVGRAMWDNWLLDTALRAGIPVVDATRCVTAIHPYHDYPEDWLWDELAEHNRSLCDVPPNMGRISEATWVMTKEGIGRQ